ncbi:MAG: NfeD family protein [Bacteroidales bacterium]|nr:NfeD family protein [Bacteroidales bacterium]MCF8403367.1 NfeD family protein [Bacteroidales bacterium]
MTWTIISVLILIGFLFLLLEILVLPGTNIAGIIGFILIAIGIYQAYASYGTLAGSLTLGGSVILSVIFLYIALKSNTWNKASLKKNIDSKVNLVDLNKIKVGDTGKAISRLAPMGKAYLNGEYYEVRSNGELIDEGSEIEVIKINVNKITVKLK